MWNESFFSAPQLKRNPLDGTKHSRMKSLNRQHLFASLGTAALLLLVGASVSAPTEENCLALGFGRWLPRTPDWLPGDWWREPPHIRLLADSAALIDGDQWYALSFAPQGDTISHNKSVRPIQIYEFLWHWRAPSTDSIVLIRPAALSVGLLVRGRWKGDNSECSFQCVAPWLPTECCPILPLRAPLPGHSEQCQVDLLSAGP